MHINEMVNKVFLYPRPWVLTGAGISTESGIPDFRSSGGIWEKVDPIENFSTWALYNNPQGFFTHGLPMFEQVLNAKPNLAHQIVGELQSKRFMGPIITQNIDSLHQKGGAAWIYEVHGHIRTATCISCHKKTVTMEELFELVSQGEIPPQCDCGGILKPDVILFGDAMPDDFQDAIKLIRCHQSTDNMIIVIGSSLTVSPINSFPGEFEELAIINNSPTALDNNAGLIITGSAGDIMQKIKARLMELNEGQELEPLPAGFIPGRLAAIVFDLWNSFNTKPDKKNSQDKLNKIRADICLTEKLLMEYPRLNERPPLEKYIIAFSLALIQNIKAELFASSQTFNSANGYLPRSLDDIINSHYEALISYLKQSNRQPEVIKELALQILGLIGLYRYMGTLEMQTFDNNLTDELVTKIMEVLKRCDIEIDMEKALSDY